MYRQIITIILVLLILITILALYISKIISDPIIEATNFSKEIASGNLNTKKIKVKGNNEISILSSTSTSPKLNQSSFIQLNNENNKTSNDNSNSNIDNNNDNNEKQNSIKTELQKEISSLNENNNKTNTTFFIIFNP
jgi:methyl-accepting chemotaxis protein